MPPAIDSKTFLPTPTGSFIKAMIVSNIFIIIRGIALIVSSKLKSSINFITEPAKVLGSILPSLSTPIPIFFKTKIKPLLIRSNGAPIKSPRKPYIPANVFSNILPSVSIKALMPSNAANNTPIGHNILPNNFAIPPPSLATVPAPDAATNPNDFKKLKSPFPAPPTKLVMPSAILAKGLIIVLKPLISLPTTVNSPFLNLPAASFTTIGLPSTPNPII